MKTARTSLFRCHAVAMAVTLGLTLTSASGETPAEFVQKLFAPESSASHFLDESAIPLYTPDIQALMRRAIAMNERFIVEHPDVKPYLCEFTPLVPGMDAFSAFRLFTAPIDTTAKRQLVIVELRYTENTDRDYGYFTLAPKEDTWLIADIRWVSRREGGDEILKNDLKKVIVDMLTTADDGSATHTPPDASKAVKSSLGYEATGVAAAEPGEGTQDTVIKKDGKEIARIPDAVPVSFSPDGAILLLREAAADDGCRHFLITVAAGKVSKAPGGHHRVGGRYVVKAEWSKDSKTITFTNNKDLAPAPVETITVADHLATEAAKQK